MVATFLARVETLGIATIGQSPLLTGFLSAVHLLGFTLLVGAVLLSGLRLLGLLFPDRPIEDVASATGRAMAIGLGISVVSGALLLAPRLSGTLENSIFQVKLLLIAAAVVFHAGIYRHAIRGGESSLVPQKVSGSLAIVLWFGVAIAGCAFIVFE
jgi:hypothetical protein